MNIKQELWFSGIMFSMSSLILRELGNNIYYDWIVYMGIFSMIFSIVMNFNTSEDEEGK